MKREDKVTDWTVEFIRRHQNDTAPPARSDAEADRRIHGFELMSGKRTLDDIFPDIEPAELLPDEPHQEDYH